MTKTARIESATFAEPLRKCPIEFKFMLPDGRSERKDIRLEKVRHNYKPTEYDEIILLYTRENCGGEELDVMLCTRFDCGKRCSVIVYGHWNDGVVE